MASTNSSLKEAIALMEAGESDAAINLASLTLDENANNPAATYAISRAFIDLNRPGLAQIICQHHLKLTPQDPAGWVNLGNAFFLSFKLDEAEAAFKKALSMEPRHNAALNNLSMIYVNKNQPELAERFAKRALAENPDLHDAWENVGFSKLMRHDWSGWKDYNRSIGNSSDRKDRSFRNPTEPVWDGTKKQLVVVFGEQGVGDEIFFAQAIEDMQRDCDVIIECSPNMEKLFDRSFNCPVYGTRYRHNQTWPEQYDIDARLAFGKMMEFYRMKESDFHGEPYLIPDPEKRKWWKAILAQYPGRKIGLAWNGGTRKTGESIRSIPLETFLPLMKGDTFVCLEYRNVSEEIRAFHKEHGIRILDFSRYINHKDYDDTAALVAELDKVVTVTTAMVDLCGAIGQECDVFVPTLPQWRFCKDTPWYKSVNLVRQKGTWKETLKLYAKEFFNV